MMDEAANWAAQLWNISRFKAFPRDKTPKEKQNENGDCDPCRSGPFVDGREP